MPLGLLWGLICLVFCLPPLAYAAVFELANEGDGVIGSPIEHIAAHEDTFVSIARTYDVGYRELVLANPGVDPWLPGEGAQVLVPSQFVLPDAPRTGIVLNVPEMRLYYFPPAAEGARQQVMTFPVSVGRQDWSTPYGRTRVTAKQRNPSWYPPQSIRDEHAADGRPLPRVVPPGPDNPLGRHALRLGIPGYLIHGTNRPAGVGMRVTHGCVRMFPADIAELYGLVGVGTAVRIVNQPFKMGWVADELYLEVHPPLEEDAETIDRGLTALVEVFVSNTDERLKQVDWGSMEAVYNRGLGVPEALAVEFEGPDLEAAAPPTEEVSVEAAHEASEERAGV
ncbi:MAG: L,D-transpeptidase family protein [Pseudomonadota bacterium]